MTRKTEKTPALAPVESAIAAVLDKAKADIKEEQEKTLEQRADEAFAGDRTFNIDGWSFTLEKDLGKDMFLTQGALLGTFQKWRKNEPRISDKCKAPLCYEDKESIEYKALTKILQETNPLFPSAYALFQQLSASTQPLTQTQQYQLMGARGQLDDAQEAIKRVRKTLSDYYFERVKKPDEAGEKREAPGPKRVITDMASKLGKRAGNKNAVPVDARMFRLAESALLWVLQDIDGFNTALLQRQAAEAKEAQDKKAKANQPALNAAVDAAVKAAADNAAATS